LVISQINRRCVLRSGSGLCIQLALTALSCVLAGGRSSACAVYRILQPRWPHNFRLAPDVMRPVTPADAFLRIAPVRCIFQCRPWRNFRLAPYVTLRLPGLANLRLAPFVFHSGQTYHAAFGLRRMPHSSPGLAANLRPSSEPDLQLARQVTPGLRQMLSTLASPVTQLSTCADCCVAPAKLATSP